MFVSGFLTELMVTETNAKKSELCFLCYIILENSNFCSLHDLVHVLIVWLLIIFYYIICIIYCNILHAYFKDSHIITYLLFILLEICQLLKLLYSYYHNIKNHYYKQVKSRRLFSAFRDVMTSALEVCRRNVVGRR